MIMITVYLRLIIVDYECRIMITQSLNGTLPHSTRDILDLLRNLLTTCKFVIARGFPYCFGNKFLSPLPLPDLSPLGYFLWGYI